jgi:hypothetical protein
MGQVVEEGVSLKERICATTAESSGDCGIRRVKEWRTIGSMAVRSDDSRRCVEQKPSSSLGVSAVKPQHAAGRDLHGPAAFDQLQSRMRAPDHG